MVVPQVVYVVHSHVSYQIQAQTCKDVLENFSILSNKQDPAITICLTQPPKLGAGQSEQSGLIRIGSLCKDN